MKKKIVEINSVAYGSTGNIMTNLSDEFNKLNIDTFLFVGHNRGLNNKFIRIGNRLSNLTSMITSYFGFDGHGSYFATKKLINKIKKIKPDVIHLHNIHGYYLNYKLLFKFLANDYDGNIIWTLHDCWAFTGHCSHFDIANCDKWKTNCKNCPLYKSYPKSILDDSKRMFFYKKKIFTSISPNKMILVTPSQWLKDQVKASFLNKYNIVTINNGLNTNIFKCYDTKMLRDKLNVNNKKILLHVTPEFSDDINHVKGGYYLLQLAKKLVNKDILILIIGDNKTIEKKLDNIIFLGKINDPCLLARYYSMADLFILTSKKETFSMTTAEALSCGTPVVGFKAGAPEQIALSKYSDFVDFANVEELYNKVMERLKNGKNKEIEKLARNKYSKEHMANEYLKIINSMEKSEDENINNNIIRK